MRYLLLLVVLSLPAADIYATLRLSAWSNLPAWLWFSLGAIAGWIVLASERMSFRARTLAMLSGQQPVLPSLFDSGRKVVAGIFFILPGVVSDGLALLLLLIPINLSRRLHSQPAAQGGPQVFEGDYRRTD